jgi:hypothetical protein
MVALLRFVLAVLVSPFKARSRLEVENAVLRHQLNVLAIRAAAQHHHNRWMQSRRLQDVTSEFVPMSNELGGSGGFAEDLGKRLIIHGRSGAGIILDRHGLTPAEFVANLKQTNAAPASATGRDAARHGGFAPRPVAASSQLGQSKEQETPVLSS